ncbi:MAG: ArnT family glycosyltransferase [Pyrinomonadaceae bacterium]
MSRILTCASLTSDRAVLVYLSLTKLVIHLLTNSHYGYFRDELYYIACGEHLAWGYADQPPLIAVVVRGTRALLGDSLFALRLPAALVGALLAFVAGLIVRELGGRRFALVVAALAIIIAPVYLYLHTVLTMNAFEPLCWTLCAYLVVLIIKYDRPRLWPVFGLVAGLGLLNKHSMLTFGFSIVLSLLLTPARKYLFSKWLVLGGLIAAVIFLPNVVWEMRHDWATVEVLRNAAVNQNLPLSPFGFFTGQLQLMHPLTLPVWLGGLYYYLFARAGRPYRALGFAYVILFVLFVVLKGKIYYLAPAYPWLFAGGAVAWEQVVAYLHRPWLKPVTVALLLAGGIVTAPLMLPMLPVETYRAYARTLGVEGVKTEKLAFGALPQHFADMFGWPELTATVADVYHRLPPREQGRCAIFARNYGEAGAIDFFGPRYGLPKSIGKHQNYWLWGPRDYTGECVITVGERLKDVQKTFDQVEQVATFTHPYVMPYENNLPIFLCHRPKLSLKEVWPRTKCYSC